MPWNQRNEYFEKLAFEFFKAQFFFSTVILFKKRTNLSYQGFYHISDSFAHLKHISNLTLKLNE